MKTLKALLLLTILTLTLCGCGGDALPGSLLGQWTLTGYGSTDALVSVAAGSTVTILFDDEGNASGNSGCNSYGGAYDADSDGELVMGMLAMTEMACLDQTYMTQESAYMTILGTVTTWLIENDVLILASAEQELRFSK